MARAAEAVRDAERRRLWEEGAPVREEEARRAGEEHRLRREAEAARRAAEPVPVEPAPQRPRLGGAPLLMILPLLLLGDER